MDEQETEYPSADLVGQIEKSERSLSFVVGIVLTPKLPVIFIVGRMRHDCVDYYERIGALSFLRNASRFWRDCTICTNSKYATCKWPAIFLPSLFSFLVHHFA